MQVEQKVFVVDNLEPEVLAMLQAFYSRSDKSIAERLPELGNTTESIKAALGKFYLGYGHSSIADCADITLFLENVSILAAKAFQDDQLYNGQETSTRYFDFENRPYVAPFGVKYKNLADVQPALVALYAKLRPLVVEQIRDTHPFVPSAMPDQNIASQLTVWKNATNARAFDIVRGLLPAGSTTQLSWKGSLRRISERLHTLATHPSDEISQLSRTINEQLCERYPNSFKAVAAEVSPAYPFYDLDSPCTDKGLEVGEVQFAFTQYRDFREDSYFKSFVTGRKPRVVVPNYFNLYGHFLFEFLLDYGSFRDIQRHRNGLCPLPMLGAYTINGYSNMFHPWYYQQLEAHSPEVEALIEHTYDTIEDTLLELHASGDPRYESHCGMQYYYPLGTIVPVTLQYGLAEAIYVSELRTSATVHPTLRQIAHGIARSVKEVLPEIPLTLDNSPDGFVLKRGRQTILERDPVQV